MWRSREKAADDTERLREAIIECIGMIDNCAGVPKEPDSLVQMVRERLGREISESSPTPETGLSLSDALPECMFRFCPTVDKCKANGCPMPWPKVYESKTEDD